MNFYTRYIWAVWKKAKGVNMLTVIYMIPFLVAIMFILVTNVFPIIAQYSFIMKSNFNYIYKFDFNTDQKFLDDLNNESLFIGYNKSVMAYEEDYITNSVESIIHISTPNRKLDNTKFTKGNFLSYNGELKENNIYLSYDCAKALNLDLVDSCAIEFTKLIPGSVKADNRTVEFKVSGILKPNYEDSSPYRTPNNNICLAVVDDEIYNWLIDNVDYDERFYYIYYSDDLVDLSKYEDNSISFSYKTKKDLFNDTKEYYMTPNVFLSKSANIIISIITLFAILLFELRYLRKKHSRNMRIISMLGLSHNGIKRLYMGLSLTNFLISYIISFLLFKFILIDLVIEIYYTQVQLIILSFVILVFSTIFTYLQSLKIKVV